MAGPVPHREVELSCVISWHAICVCAIYLTRPLFLWNFQVVKPMHEVCARTYVVALEDSYDDTKKTAARPDGAMTLGRLWEAMTNPQRYTGRMVMLRRPWKVAMESGGHGNGLVASRGAVKGAEEAVACPDSVMIFEHPWDVGTNP